MFKYYMNNSFYSLHITSLKGFGQYPVLGETNLEHHYDSDFTMFRNFMAYLMKSSFLFWLFKKNISSLKFHSINFWKEIFSGFHIYSIHPYSWIKRKRKTNRQETLLSINSIYCSQIFSYHWKSNDMILMLYVYFSPNYSTLEHNKEN